MDDVTIIEPVSTRPIDCPFSIVNLRMSMNNTNVRYFPPASQDSMPSTTQKSNSIVDQVLSVEPMDSISITAISSSSSANGSSHQTQEPVPEVTISPAPGSNSTITSSTSLMKMVEQAALGTV